MAGVGEAATIGGLIGVAGQTVQAASTLYTFFKAYKDVHPKVQETTSTLESLLGCLKSVQRALSNAKVLHGHAQNSIAEVAAAVEKCHGVLEEVGNKMQPIMTAVKGVRRAKLKIAAQRDYFTTINQQLVVRWQNLATLLGSAEWSTGLETLREVQDVSTAVAGLQYQQDQATQHISDHMTMIDNSIQRQAAQVASANDEILQKVDVILQASTSGATRAQFDAIEARLAACQLQLQQSILAMRPQTDPTKSNPRSKRKPKVRPVMRFPKLECIGARRTTPKTACSPFETSEQLMRLVDTAILVHKRRGLQSYKVVAVEDPDFASMSLLQRKAMVGHLLGLRVLMWLLRKDNYLTSSMRHLCSLSSSSPLIREVSVASSIGLVYSQDTNDHMVGKRGRLRTAGNKLTHFEWACVLSDQITSRLKRLVIMIDDEDRFETAREDIHEWIASALWLSYLLDALRSLQVRATKANGESLVLEGDMSVLRSFFRPEIFVFANKAFESIGSSSRHRQYFRNRQRLLSVMWVLFKSEFSKLLSDITLSEMMYH